MPPALHVGVCTPVQILKSSTPPVQFPPISTWMGRKSLKSHLGGVTFPEESGGRSNGDVRRGDGRFSVGHGAVRADGVSPAPEVSPGSSRRLLVGLWITAGLAAGSWGFVLALEEGAPTAMVVMLAVFVGALVLLPLLVLRAGHLSARS